MKSGGFKKNKIKIKKEQQKELGTAPQLKKDLGEKQFCSRCTNIHFCVKVGKKWYCDPCFQEVVNDPETKRQMEQIMIQCGIEDLE